MRGGEIDWRARERLPGVEKVWGLRSDSVRTRMRVTQLPSSIQSLSVREKLEVSMMELNRSRVGTSSLSSAAATGRHAPSTPLQRRWPRAPPPRCIPQPPPAPPSYIQGKCVSACMESGDPVCVTYRALHGHSFGVEAPPPILTASPPPPLLTALPPSRIHAVRTTSTSSRRRLKHPVPDRADGAPRHRLRPRPPSSSSQG